MEAREIKLSSTGRIYGSKPAPVIDDAKSYKAGGDHIRDKRSVPGRMLWMYPIIARNAIVYSGLH
jgi:hypothetical protein